MKIKIIFGSIFFSIIGFIAGIYYAQTTTTISTPTSTVETTITGNTKSINVEPLMSISDALELSSMILVCQ